MALNIDIVGGETPGKERGRAMSFGAGRVCEAEGCTTRLSIYNSRSRCALHDFDISLVQFRSPSPAPAEAETHDDGRHSERQQSSGTHRLVGPSRPRRPHAA